MASWLADDPKHRVFAHPEAQRPPAPGLHDFVQTDMIYIYIHISHICNIYIYMIIYVCVSTMDGHVFLSK